MNAIFLKDLPAQLQSGECFVTWRYEVRDGKQTKPPVNPRTGEHANVADSSTWSNLDTAIDGAHRFKCPGIGRVVTPGEGLCGVDLDKCRNQQTGELTPLARTIVKTLNSYTEITPSCCGLRVWIRAKPPGTRCRKNGVEIYTGGRYFTLTGNHLPNTPKTVEPRQAELGQIYNMLFSDGAKAAGSNGHNKKTGDPWASWRAVPDDDLVRRALKNVKFKQLWDGDTSEYGGDDSRADAALCCHLAFWTGKDQERIERLFNHSKLANRDKWQERAEYRQRTISNAIDNTTEVWRPNVRHVPATAENGWPDPSPLGDELPPVGPLDSRFIPHSFRLLIEDVSDRMQIPQDYAAAIAVVALAGCVGRRASIRPKALDHSWRVTPNLWGANIAPPGYMKSPVLRSVTLPLAHIEELWCAEHEQECEVYETERELSEIKRQAWREESKKSIKKGGDPTAAPDNTIKTPAQKRLILTDSTFEKLHEILSDNPAGVLVVRDELTGWLAQLDKQGREGERGFYLQGWNGDGGYNVDRIGRGSIRVPAVCISLFGNIQPSRLRSYLSSALAGGPSDDGLFQRFQIIVWPDPPREWKLVDRLPDNAALAVAEKVFNVLSRLSIEEPIEACFAPDAQELFFEWWKELEGKIRGESGLHPAMLAHLSKYRSLMPSLALLFALADLAAVDAPIAANMTVGLDHARQAAAYCGYLESHARRVYACVVSPETAAARDLARHIKAGDLPALFSTRDVYFRGWTGLDSPERVRAALDLLEDAAWVRKAEPSTSPSGGRPSEGWVVNPKVMRAK